MDGKLIRLTRDRKSQLCVEVTGHLVSPSLSSRPIASIHSFPDERLEKSAKRKGFNAYEVGEPCELDAAFIDRTRVSGVYPIVLYIIPQKIVDEANVSPS